MLTSRFEATPGQFWDGPRNFEPRSDDEDDIRVGTLSSNFHTTPTGGQLAPFVGFSVQQAPYTADLQWNRVSNLEPSGLKAETLPVGRCDLQFS
ncbi:hypothetical protein AVEN_49985-1 [Araneus ventricosus]|uniref:Uncharacterized protein n=1 Tax=Araneus ventricosus TaxID=182803 RepID=A0A4Y2D0H8_ARAVE|nr:hypothetical protein AVEN_49985-1 [Araneus ventricosus]